MAVRVIPARSPASVDQRCQTSCRGGLAPAWLSNGVIPQFKTGLLGYMSGLMQATFSRCRYTMEFRAMCDGTPSCCRIHSWHPLASYVLIKLKLTSRRLLLYFVYMCQNSLNFIGAFSCYKQKWKLAPFNLAHPVWRFGLPLEFPYRRMNCASCSIAVEMALITGCKTDGGSYGR